jgi:hypothetical protein
MSIEANYWRITPKAFARLKAEPKRAEAFFGLSLEVSDETEAIIAEMLEPEREDFDRSLYIGTDWHALHFLLTGDGELEPHPVVPPLGNAIQGGTETEWPCTYGQVRSLNPQEVRDVAAALAKISVAELRSRFSVAAFNAAGIYPHGRRGAWTEREVESAFESYPRLVEFFQQAAKQGDIVLLSSS